MKKYLQILIKICSFIFFIISWNFLAKIIGNSFLLPSFKEISIAIIEIIKSQNFAIIIFNTVKKLVLATLISVFVSGVASTLSYKFSVIRVLIRPYVAFLKALPTITVIILVLIWSSSEYVAITVGTIILTPILYDNILSALFDIDKNILNMSKVFDISKYNKIKNIYVPGVYYHICGGLHSLIGLTFKVIIAGEVLAQENYTIGGEIFLKKMYLESSDIFAWVIIVIIMNYFIEELIIKINNRLTRWR